MSAEEFQDQRSIRYLLGELNEEEQTELEDAYFSDDAFFEHLAAVETELIDSYVQGELSAGMRARFEGRYLGSPRQVERIQFARRLLQEKQITRPETVERKGWWRRYGMLPSLRKPLIAFPVAVIAVAVAVSVVWWTYRPDRAETTETPKAHLQPSPGKRGPPTRKGPEVPSLPAAPVPESGIVALSLTPGLTRSAGEGVELTIKPSDTLIRFTVEYEGEVFAAYRVVIRTPEGRELWRESGLKPVLPGGRRVVAIMPADKLPSGDYVLTLSAAPSTGVFEDVADYSFRVAKQQDAVRK